jgi:GntR family transcriptional regulator/MocR family aminotransferase
VSKPAAGTMLAITLNPASEIPLFQQLYSRIRDGILGGGLPPGSRLPSSRTLAADLAVSRTTVLNAFDQLTAEGYLEGRVGAGTRVAPHLPETLLPADARVAPSHMSVVTSRLGDRQQRRWLQRVFWLRTAAPRPLQPGNPDLTAFPRHVWARLTAKHWRRAPESILGYGDSMGSLPLRAAIADYVRRIRGVRCRPEHVAIVGGSQQALYLCGQVLLARNDVAWMEDPGYPGARAAFAAADAMIVPVPVDEQGLIVATRRRKNLPTPQLVYVTPSHQCPLGMAMSLSRRLELLEFANRVGAWIVEDDYDSEYRYFSRPLASLQSLDTTGRVVYIGTVSKTLLPALRMGYVILPESLVDAFGHARAVIDRQPAGVDQLVLADFIAQGWLERHIRQTRVRYLERQRALVDSIRQEIPELLDASPSDGGMYLVAWLKQGLTGATAANAADGAGVSSLPLSRFFIGPPRRDGLVLGYGAYDVPQIRTAVKTLSRALRDIKAVVRQRARKP